MKFKNFLKESLDDPYKWVKTSGKKVIFYTDDENGRENNGDQVEVDFAERHFNGIDSIEIWFRRGTNIKMTGQGDAFRILATIKDIIIKDKRFLKSQEIIFFASKEDEVSRTKLYRIFAKKIQALLGKKTLDIKNFKNQYLFILSDGIDKKTLDSIYSS